MARRRYISTAISTDTAVCKLAKKYGEFAAMLYTWMIPHAEDDAKLTGNIDELAMLVIPGFRWKTDEEIECALNGMVECGLVSWDREKEVISFPESFFMYQSYITKDRREKQDKKSDDKNQRKTAQNAADQRKTAQNAADQRKTALRLSSSLGTTGLGNTVQEIQEQKAYPPIPPEGGCEEMPDIASHSGEAAMAMGSPETISQDEPPESPHDPRPDSDHVPKRPKSRSPLEGVPYDGRTLSAICEMYELVPNYLPDAPSEIRLIQELGQEYPKIDLLREFRRARDWLLKAHPKKRPKGEHGLRAFLRNWVAKGVNKYGLGQPRIIGFETVTEFVPVPDEGGIANAGGP